MADSSGNGERRRKHKSPAASSAASLPLPRLPDHFIDRPSDDEKETKRRDIALHRLFTVRKGMDEDEYDRLKGINSVDLSSEEERFGGGELTNTENPVDGVANDSGASGNSHSQIGSCRVLLKARGGVVVLA